MPTWSTDFVVTINNVRDYAPDILETDKVIKGFLEAAQSDEEDELKVLIRTKFKNHNCSLPENLPVGEELNKILSWAYPVIRKRIIYRTLMRINKREPEIREYWKDQLNRTVVDDIMIAIDVNSNGVTDADEYFNFYEENDNWRT